jgi:tetratricopeptide (TPR) repeat protein
MFGSISHLSAGLIFVGEYDQACVAQEESLTIFDNLGFHWDRAWALFLLASAEPHRGDYEKARTFAQELLNLPKDTGEWTVADDARAHWLLGMLALAEEAYAEAQEHLRESIAAYREYGLPNELVVAQADSAVAAYGQGQPEVARQYLHEALQTTVEAQIGMSLVHILPIVARFLASTGEPERAVEVYALASRYPYVANSVWFEDVVGEQVAAATADLAPDVVAAAQARGRERDLWETAEALLHELDAEVRVSVTKQRAFTGNDRGRSGNSGSRRGKVRKNHCRDQHLRQWS